MNAFGLPLPGRQPEQLEFHIQRHEEIGLVNKGFGNPVGNSIPLDPQHREYRCGICGSNTTGRVLCDVTRPDGAKVQWCLCACDRMEPSVFISKDGVDMMQQPMPRHFHVDPNWPPDLAALYEEASLSLSAGAHTACAMVCRKLLMATACHEGDSEDKSFAEYVHYITDAVLTFPKAKASIDKIRGIGNEANHNVQFVSPADARRAMQIVTYMLNAIYALPAA